MEILDMMRENGAQLFLHHGQSLKAEAVLQDPRNIIQILKIGQFYDYIPGAELHIDEHTGLAGAVKLVSIQQVNRFVENVGEITAIRIEGLAAPNKQLLKHTFKKYAAAKACDPVLVGQEMGLFIQNDDDTLFWCPKGVIVRDLLIDLWKETIQQAGFQKVYTPGLNADQRLTFAYVSSQNLHVNELPLRLAETCEASDSIHEIDLAALHHSRLYTTDHLQIFCMEAQVQQELISSLQFFDKTFKILDFEYQWYLVASRSKASIGTPAEWKHGAAWLTNALDASGFSYRHENRQLATHGPRIELRLRDTLDREWVASRLEIDLLYPKQCDLQYQGSDSQKHRLVMLNGALYSSLERLIAMLIERHRGQLPLLLAPEQIRLLPMGERHLERAQTVSTTMKKEGFRVGIDLTQEPLGGKVHAAEKARIPYVVILGDKEKKEESLTVRFCNQNKTVNASMKLEDLLKHLKTDN